MVTDWERLQFLFHAAYDLAETERAAYLDEVCGDDPGLRAQVLALLSAESDAAATLAPDLDRSASELLASLDGGLVGTQIGAYRLLELAGVGGMGSVFRAERADGAFERQVAVKIVKRGMDSSAVVQRFERERQILARLAHPNIAALLDGGVTVDGRPFFVMEYVAGMPLVTYCDRWRLTVAARLRLFQTVCQAVHFAHQNLVVHRDLKPSNVLVTEQGQVKLLDFGIAKTLDSNDDQALTATSAMLFTPAYAAPEQLLGEAISTSTDVYALGVVLYELLVGQRPFESRKSAGALRAEILSGDPPKPSTLITRKLAGDAATASAVSHTRKLDIDALRQRIRGDLDVICLTALRRVPAERYGSAQALAQDLELHLQQQPVTARPPTLAYRVAKFVRRNRLPLWVGAVTLAGALSVIAFYTRALAEQRDVAVAEQAKTEHVVQFVIGLFKQADPGESRGEEVTARELLEAGTKQVDAQLQAQPAIRAKLKQVLGSVYYSLGSARQAEALLSSALSEQLTSNSTDLEIAETQLLLGFVRQDAGDYTGAAALFAASRALRELRLNANAAAVGEVIGAQAFLAQSEGQFEQAEGLFVEALSLARARVGSGVSSGDDPYLAKAMNQLAELYRLMDRPRDAEPLLDEALQMQRRIYGRPHPESADTKRMLAGLYRDTGRYEASQILYQEVLAERTKLLGEYHREVIHTWNSYSQLLSAMGDHEGMLQANAKMIQLLEHVRDGKPDVSLPGAYHNRAYALKQLGRLLEAITYFERAIAAQDAVGMAPDHPNRAYPIASMGQSYRLLGNTERAIQLGRSALALRRQHYPEDHRLISEIKSDLGHAHMTRGEFDLAESYFLEAYAAFKDRHGEEAEQVREARNNLYQLYVKAGESKKAAQYAPD